MNIPERVRKKREKFRKFLIPKYYNGILHLALTSFLSFGLGILCLLVIDNSEAWQYIMVPTILILGNLTEYIAHRYPLHNSMKYLSKVYHNHTLIHHFLFSDKSMEFENVNDYKMALLSPILISLLVLGLILPVSSLVYFLTGLNGGLIFAGTSLIYLGAYEIFHFIYHIPENNVINHLPLISFMRRHHTLHHNQAKMQTTNFNIIFPLFDILFNTLESSRHSN